MALFVGLRKDLPDSLVPGDVYIAEDTKELYFPWLVGSPERVRICRLRYGRQKVQPQEVVVN